MKKLFFFLFLSVLFFSCRTPAPAYYENGEVEQGQTPLKLKPFDNKYLLDNSGRIVVPDLVVKHTLFYNSTEINLLSERTGIAVKAENGVMKKKDSTGRKLKVIPANTPGTVKELVRDRYGISKILVSFDEDDETYSCWFGRERNGKFSLIESGSTSRAIPSSMYNPDDDPLDDVPDRPTLLFEYKFDKVSKSMKEQATGNRTGAEN